MADNEKSRTEILQFLGELDSRYAEYHNHKETTAWAGVAVFVVLLPSLVGAIVKGRSFSCPINWALTIAVVMVTIAFIIYLREQFAARKRGGDLGAASLYLRAKYVSEPNVDIDPKLFVPPKAAQGPFQSNFCLPDAVLKQADILSNQGQKVQTYSEKCGYSLVIFVAAFCIAGIWLGMP